MSIDTTQKHIAGLDNLRCLALCAVMLAHMRLLGVGWITMQTFFVLSGFLISGILLREREEKSFGRFIKKFYARRTLRIFPVYYVFLMLMILASFSSIAVFNYPSSQIAYAALYVWNWFAITFDGNLNHNLEHFWSLSVEEQFYLVWPMAVFFLRGKNFFRFCAVLVVAGPVIRYLSVAWWTTSSAVAIDPYKALYQMSTTHIDAFATGALIHWAWRQPWSTLLTPTRLYFGVALALLLGWMASGTFLARSGPYNSPVNLGFPIHMEHNYQYVWGYTVLNLLSAWLIILITRNQILPTLFRNPHLARLGVISYGAYIFHLPILYSLRPSLPDIQDWIGSPAAGLLVFLLVYFVATFALAELSYRWIESPFLRMKSKFRS